MPQSVLPHTITALLLAQLAAAKPCDILGAANPPTPCVAAHSTTRALYQAYHGSLYRLKRDSDKAQTDVGLVAPGGVVNVTEHEAFCNGHQCTVIRVYDQSPQANHLDTAPPGENWPHPDRGVNASAAPFSLSGGRVFALRFEGGMGYRNDNTSGVPTGDNPETIYMVADGNHFNSECCFDYGNAEVDNNDDGAGTMEAVSLSTHNDRQSGVGQGPWILADLEDGMWASGTQPGNAKGIRHNLVTAILKGGSSGPNTMNGHYAIKGGDAQSGPLTVYYDGPRPKGYSPMKKQGAIILGIGGDNSERGVGTFFEGVIAAGFTSDATDTALQADIVGARYGK